jgi:hypothetical protein
MTRNAMLATVATLALAVASTPEAWARKARVRVIHNYATTDVPQPATVDVRIGSGADPATNPVAATLAYGDVTDYLKLEPGTYTVGVFAAGSTSAKLLDTQLTLAKRDRVTVLARQVSATDASFTADVVSDVGRRSMPKAVNVRVVHGIPSTAADGVRIGAAGVGCLTPPVSFPAQAVVTVPKGDYALGVFAPTDPDCAGTPITGLSAEATLKGRREYTAVARIAPGDPASFQLLPVQDF